MYYNPVSPFLGMITLFASMELHVLQLCKSLFGDDYSFCEHGTTCTTICESLFGT